MKKRSPVSDSSDSELKSAQAQDPADDENETQSKRSDEFARLLEDSFRSTRKSLSTGDRVKSEILSIGREDVFVSTGTMHDGVIRKKELMGEAGQLKYQVGDSVELYVTQVRGSEIFLSMSAPVKSHSSRPRREPRGFQVPEEGRAEAPSRRNQFQEKRELSERSFLATQRPGDVVSGKVARIEKFGAFVTLSDGVDGLIHISELSWSRVEDPQQVVQMGQTVQVKILSTEYREGRLKVALSLKAAAGDPWSLAAQRYPVGSVVKGQIQRREPFGLFVQLEEGIVGLFPKSKAVDDPKFAYDKFRAKDEVTLQVAELNIEQRRMTLKLPGDSGEENWKGFASASSGSFGTLGDQLRARTSSKAEPKKERKK